MKCQCGSYNVIATEKSGNIQFQDGHFEKSFKFAYDIPDRYHCDLKPEKQQMFHLNSYYITKNDQFLKVLKLSFRFLEYQIEHWISYSICFRLTKLGSSVEIAFSWKNKVLLKSFNALRNATLH